MSLELPTLLRPWRSALDLFPDSLAPSLGALVARVAVVIGPLAESRASHAGELDGVAGLSRRGPLERLLASEWAIFEAFPDEFIRRAASGELAFLEMARREPQDDRRSIALFDAGVAQLGGPRVVHLAALIALHARAEKGGAEFIWGIAQDPSCRVFSELNRSSIKSLVSRRFEGRLTGEDIARWRIALGESKARRDREVELWLIGSADASTIAARENARALVVEDSLEPSRPRVVRVEARAPGTAPRTAELELPEADAAIRLLRDPFGIARPALTMAPSVSSRFVFGSDGRHLFARTANGALATFPVPNSPNAKYGVPVTWAPPEGHRIFAVGRHRGKHARTHVLTRGKDGKLFHHALARAHKSSYRSVEILLGEIKKPSIPDEIVPLATTENGDGLVFVDADGRVLGIRNRALHDEVTWRAIALRASPQGLVALSEGPSVHVYLHRGLAWSEHGGPVSAYGVGVGAPLGDRVALAFFGNGDALAVRDGTEIWRARVGTGPDRLIPGGGARVFGVATERVHNRTEPLLIVAGEGSSSIDFVAPGGGRRRSIAALGAVRFAQASEHGPALAVQTDKALAIYHLNGQLCASFALEALS